MNYLIGYGPSIGLGLVFLFWVVVWVVRQYSGLASTQDELCEGGDDGNVIDEVNRIIAAAVHHHENIEWRQQELNSLADQIVRLHGYDVDSDEGDILADVVLSHQDYADTVMKVMSMRAQQGGQ